MRALRGEGRAGPQVTRGPARCRLGAQAPAPPGLGTGLPTSLYTVLFLFRMDHFSRTL